MFGIVQVLIVVALIALVIVVAFGFWAWHHKAALDKVDAGLQALEAKVHSQDIALAAKQQPVTVHVTPAASAPAPTVAIVQQPPSTATSAAGVSA